MVRIRELAFVTTAAMAAMTGAALWQSLQPPKAPMIAAAPLRVHPIPAAVTVRASAPAPKLVVAAAKPVPVEAPAAAADTAIDTADEGDAPAGVKQITAAEMIAQEAQLDAQADGVAARIEGRVPADLMRYFDVVLYVSKAGSGAWAQHMFVFHRTADGSLAYEKNFPVSTGREQHEKYFTDTPAGIFELDPARFEPMHYSHTWHGAPMQWSMFLNLELHNRMVGIALHSAGGHAADLGHRASGGCVRLPPEQADLLYHRFQSEERGMVPVLAFDNVSGSTSRTGETMKTPGGLPLMTEGYKVLLIIEDYPGGPALVAVLS
ncbi:MAG: L,D-transpeptidase [Rhizomicrobium sp.]